MTTASPGSSSCSCFSDVETAVQSGPGPYGECIHFSCCSHKFLQPSWLKTAALILSGARRSEVQSQGVTGLSSRQRLWGSICFFALRAASCGCQRAVAASVPWLVAVSLQPLPPASHHLLPCVYLCPPSSVSSLLHPSYKETRNCISGPTWITQDEPLLSRPLT